ncbi:unnamed protein product, partial [Brenthis ino]
MGAARLAPAPAPPAAAAGGAGTGVVRRRPARAPAALRQPVPHHRHLPDHTDVPQEPLSPADAGWHRQRYHRRQQRLQ